MLLVLAALVLSVSCGHYEKRYNGDEISDDDDDDLGPGSDDDDGGDDDSQIDDDDGPGIDNYSWVNDKGDTVELYDYLGDVVMLNVGAGWCKPCREDAPNIEDQLYQPFKDQGFTLIELIVEDDLYQIPSAEFLQSWRDQYDLSYIICADPDWTLLSYFDTISLPFALILDRELKPVFQSHGYDEAIFTDTIEELL
jgi:thiol-disulfide isomerase/thioredoxin